MRMISITFSAEEQEGLRSSCRTVELITPQISICPCKTAELLQPGSQPKFHHHHRHYHHHQTNHHHPSLFHYKTGIHSMFHFEATLHLSGGIRSQAWAKPPQRYKLPATRSRNSHVGWSPFRPRLHRTNATFRMKVANYWKKMYIIGWISIVMWILTRRDIYRVYLSSM